MTTNYAITGVWMKDNKTGSEHISHVLLHEVKDNSVYSGKKTTKDEVILLLRSKTIRTLKWNYVTSGWSWGALVDTETRNGVTYLRTRPDGNTSNNLDNLINMDIFPI